MKLVELFEIPELAQNFVYTPEVEKKNNDHVLFYDYETDTGAYAWKSIIFKESLAFKRTKRKDVKLYMIDAYNTVMVIDDSDWIKEFSDVMNPADYRHFLIYFDELGAYEFLAKSAEKGDNQGREWKMPELVE